MTLRKFTTEFSRIIFQTPLPESLAAIARHLDASSSLRNVYPIRSGAHVRYAVKYFIAQSQHIFGIFHSVETAARLADMIIRKYAHLRRGKRSALTDEKLNFTVAQADRDIANENEISSLLTQFLADLDQSLLAPKPITRTRRTARSEIYAIKEEIIERLDRIEKAIARLNEGNVWHIGQSVGDRNIHAPQTFPTPFYLGDPIQQPVMGDSLPSTPLFGANSCCANPPGDANVSE